jgi:lipid A 3-O-deacylase
MRSIASPSLVRLALGLTLVAAADHVNAVDRVSVDAGLGNHVDIVGISASSADWKRSSFANDWSWSLYGAGGIALWEGRDHNTRNKYVVDLSANPVLRLQMNTASQFSPFLEASVGVNLLSNTRINDRREFSTAFQFGEFLGAGVAFGEKLQYELGLRVQHISNANIKFPNNGLTYCCLVFQYRLAEH